MNISKLPLKQEEATESLEEVNLIKVLMSGTFVEKLDVREVCGLKTSYRWYQHIRICCKDENFRNSYKDYKTNNSVSRSIAKKIIEKAFDGLKIKILFVTKLED